MRINEIENELGISKSNIRFYEKQGLLAPERTENGYRNYSDDDLETLKKIIVYRKLGISVESIRKIFDGTLDLQEAVSASITELEAEIEKLNGSIELCHKVQKRGETNESFNQNYYLDIICADEKQGKRFVDIIKDYTEFEKTLLLNSFQPFLVFDRVLNLEKISKKSKTGAIIVMLLLCTVSGFAGKYLWQFGFALGFFRPFLLFLFLSLLFLPYYLLKDKSEKGVRIWLYFVFVLFSLITVILIGFLIYLIIQLLKNVNVSFW